MLRSLSFAALLSLSTSTVLAQDLVVDGTTMTLGGFHRYDNVSVINGGRIVVVDFDGTDRENTGNLVLVADRITVDATSSISARGAGYGAARCGDGRGPTAGAGGRGGCAVRDSGGGGAHFGAGGRGTKDCDGFGDPSSCQFPEEFEESCGNSLNVGGTACTTVTNCRTNDALPTVAGTPYWHSIWATEFGAAGGDKGCRDGDGFGTSPAVAGRGGGRIVLAAVNPAMTGAISIEGTVTASGRRGCGIGNDSAGGGAGGSIMIVGDSVTIGASANVSAAGGLGGDTLAGAMSSPDSADCPSGAQTSGTCDDCGGGGGGGIVSVLSGSTASIAPGASFDVSGGDGGVCAICRGEAGGGTGELQLNVAYVGEICDGYDNDFDGMVDDGLGTVGCGLGMCEAALPACSSGSPTACMPDTSMGASCRDVAACNKPRIAVILDTSASMLENLDGYATFGDGSVDHPGLDTDGNGIADDSRLFLAKRALGEVISSYPEIDFALARYHQDQATDQSCQLATWIECAGIFATYDDPRDNIGPVSCTVATSPTTSVSVRRDSAAREACINYAGSCGGPRRGADVLSGFGSDTRDVVRWLDHRESMFVDAETTGDYCDHGSSGDCELRGTGPTPLTGSLEAIEDYIVPIRATDPCTACRGYTVVLVTDGAESCGGNPAAQAQILHDTYGLDVYVVAVSVLTSERASLNAIARAGGTGSATFVTAPEELVPALTSIVAGSIRFETCNGRDDDCDALVDEGFPGLGMVCDDGAIGACRGSGEIACRDDGSGTECVIDMPGGAPTAETCNVLDDDCDGRVDEGLSCMMSCVPMGPEVCNGIDDDCNGLVDETDPAIGTPCGADDGVCEAGTLRCVLGELVCIGAVEPRDEVCNGLDDDCDGEADDMAPCPGVTVCIEAACRRPCDPAEEFPCPPGLRCVPRADGNYCLPTACATCAPEERCVDDLCVDACEGVTCEGEARCIGGLCRDCRTLGCEGGELCFERVCRADPCEGVSCAGGESCYDGACAPSCDERACGERMRCSAEHACEPDPCAGVSCEAGEVCVGGSCRADACAAIGCAADQRCVAGVGCVSDRCLLVECEPGTSCRLDAAGEPQCRLDGAPPPTDRYVVAQGSGLCDAGGRSSGAWLFAIAIALVVRRRR
jgi:hypothetical protein